MAEMIAVLALLQFVGVVAAAALQMLVMVV